MNYTIPSSYQPEQPSYVPYPTKPMTMDYMPEYSAPVSSISSATETPVQLIPVAPGIPVQPVPTAPGIPVQPVPTAPGIPVQPVPTAPVSTVIPMSPDPAYLPQDLQNPNNRLTSFLNEGMFYIDYQHEISQHDYSYKVYPPNLYGEMDDSGAPIMTFTRSLQTCGNFVCLYNGTSYSITLSLNNQSVLQNMTTGQAIFTLKHSGECCSTAFTVIPEGSGMKPIKGKFSINGQEGTILINDGAGVGTISVIGDNCCGTPMTAVVVLSPKPNPQLDPFTLRLLYVFVMLSLFGQSN